MPFWAMPGQKGFHRVHRCDFRNQQWSGAIEFEARQHAEEAGFSPCPECKP
jgi:hypothetical protein